MSDQISETTTDLGPFVSAIHELSPLDQRAIKMAILLADASGLVISMHDVLTIKASDYADVFGLSLATACEQLQSFAGDSYPRTLAIDTKDKTTGHSRKTQTRWMSHIEYEPSTNAVSFQFSNVVATHLNLTLLAQKIAPDDADAFAKSPLFASCAKTETLQPA